MRSDITLVLLSEQNRCRFCTSDSSLICFILRLSVGPALIGAIDGAKGPRTEREWSPRHTEGWEQKTCQRHRPPAARHNF